MNEKINAPLVIQEDLAHLAAGHIVWRQDELRQYIARNFKNSNKALLSIRKKLAVYGVLSTIFVKEEITNFEVLLETILLEILMNRNAVNQALENEIGLDIFRQVFDQKLGI